MSADTEVLTPRHLGGLQVYKVKEAPVYSNMLIYGPWGAGKTLLAATSYDIPEMNKVIHVNVEGGTATLLETYPQIDVVNILEWADLSQLYGALRTPGHGYKTCIIDTLDEIQKISMATVMREMMEKELAKSGGETDRTLDNPSQREFGRNLEQMRRFIRMFRDLPMNVIFTAHSFIDEDERTKKRVVKPNFTGKMKDEAPSYVDAVFYLGVNPSKDGKGERVLLTDSNGEILAKSRSRKLSDQKVVQNPTMADLYYELTNTQPVSKGK